MVDYHAWVSRAMAFAENCKRLHGDVDIEIDVAPPITAREMESVAQRMSLGLPDPLRRFYVEGAQRCKCTYVTAPETGDVTSIFPYQSYLYGGARICDANEMPDYQRECEVWAEGFDEYFDERNANDSLLWHRSVPFMTVGNGDHVALDVGSSVSEPPVVYLCHDGEGCSTVIASSFDAFMETWEKLCYVGPAIWLLSDFLDPTTGLICSQTPKAEALRKMFQEAFETGVFGKKGDKDTGRMH